MTNKLIVATVNASESYEPTMAQAFKRAVSQAVANPGTTVRVKRS